MDNKLEYVLSLKDQISGKLTKIGITNDEQLDKWAKVEKQIGLASNTMKNCGVTIGGLNERISALRAEREWIPADNINAIRRSNQEIGNLEKQIRGLENINGGRLKSWFGDLKNSIPAVRMLTNPLVVLSGAVYKLNSFVKESRAEWTQAVEAQHKLRAVMQNTMGAAEDQTKSILELASAQQKIGVISTSVQIAGSQELSSYLSETSSLETLMPTMNDMLAQQYGYNATQEQATNIAMMMGKVMDGQVGALSRYGYKFTEAQERILKFGTESQRAATLAEVVGDSVKGVNAALANTPEGRLKQYANMMSDLRERVGSLAVRIQDVFLQVFTRISEAFDRLIGAIERNQVLIEGFFNAIAKVAIRVFDGLVGVLMGVVWVVRLVGESLVWVWNKLKEGNIIAVITTGVIGSLVAAITLLTIRVKLLALWKGIVATATKLWAAAQNALNLTLLANPLTWVIAGIVALIGVIAYVCYKIEGWGSLWKGVVGFMKHTFIAFVESVKLYFGTMVNGVLTGLDLVKLGWYRFKEAVGIGDSSENQAAINKINSDIEARQKAITDGAKKIASHAQKARESLLSIDMKWNSDKKLTDITKGVKTRLGLGTNEQMQQAVNSSSGFAESDNSGVMSEGSKAISSGGSRSTNITITMKDLVGSINFNGSPEDNRKNMIDEVLEALIRVINMGQSTVG